MKIVLPGLIVFALWSALCVRWYVCGIHEQCSDQPKDLGEEVVTPEEVMDSASIIEDVIEAPLTFEWSGADPLVGEEFDNYRDSLMLIFDSEPGSIVEIIGLYDPQELNNSNFENLGFARAQAVKDLLLSSGIKRSINIQAKPEDLSAGLGDRINNGVLFGLNPTLPANGFVINRNGQKLIIHFPSNSANPRSDQQVLDAIRGLAKDALTQKRTILVVGHTDNQGEARENKVLGLIRASKIKDILLDSGMAEEYVLAESEGEEDPLASNGTITGRQLNRRVELVII